MFSITVVKFKDIVVILCIISIVYILGNVVFKNIIKSEYLNRAVVCIKKVDCIKLGIRKQSGIINYVVKEGEADKKNEKISINTIFKIGMNILDAKEETKNIDENIDETKQLEEKTEDIEKQEQTETANINENVKKDVETKVVTQNPIVEKYSNEYNGIKIKNETSYNLQEISLNPDELQINKSNIIIFHTHTCESYTQSDNYRYEPSRKL